jgi:predicted small metal-binding protein
MMKFECRDLGMDCNYTVTGNTKEEVKQQAMNHAKNVHAAMLAALPKEQLAGLDKMLESKIKQSA